MVQFFYMFFDNLEYISIENQTTDFPSHFHETFCISLIHKGVEQIDFQNQKIFGEQGSISITNPFEVHANPLIDSNTPISFDTIYISKDVMKFLFDGKNISFLNKKFNNLKANQLFLEVKTAIDSKNDELIYNSLLQFTNEIRLYAQEDTEEYLQQDFSVFNEVNNFIDDNICNKFNLDELSKMANINKYGFIKKFKASSGMTPINYILMKKIFSSKTLITPDSELTDIAYQYNFTDLAHFSKTFKRFIGVSPKKFQSNISEKI